MRPLLLRMAGLRSYRAEVTIDFAGGALSDGGLLAIVGEMGVGKSSILEGIYAALYGCCTWNEREIKPLIADNVNTLRIAFTFAARGCTWRVTRATSRDGRPPARHILTCLDTGEVVEGAEAVNARVTTLVGLDRRQFQRVVVLPQNRFSQLLHASAAERTDVLRGIFGLETLERVRDMATDLLDDLTVAVAPVRAARERLHPDPAAVVAAATAERETASTSRALLSAVADLESALPLAERVVEGLAGAGLADGGPGSGGPGSGGMGRGGLAGAPGALHAAATARRAITRLSRAAARERRRLVTEREAADGELAEAVKAGEGPAELAAAQATLTELDADLGGLFDDVAAVEDTRRQSASDDARVAELADCLASAEKELDEATVGLAGPAAAARAAVTSLALREAAVADLRTLVAAVREGRDRVGAAVDRLRAANHAERTARAPAAAASALLSELRDQLDALRRANAAAHAAAGRRPGDPCPVCEQNLPDSFHPPKAIGEADLVKQITVASRQAEDLTSAADRSAAAAARVRGEVDSELAALRAGIAQARDKAADLAVATSGIEDLLDLDLDDPDRSASLLESARTEHARALGELSAVTERVAGLGRQVDVLASQLADARAVAERGSRALAAQERAVRRRAAATRRRVSRLPGSIATALTEELGLARGDEIHGLLDGLLAVGEVPETAIQSLLDDVGRRLVRLQGVHARAVALADELAALAEVERELAGRREREVDRPVAAARAALRAVAGHVGLLSAVWPPLVDAAARVAASTLAASTVAAAPAPGAAPATAPATTMPAEALGSLPAVEVPNGDDVSDSALGGSALGDAALAEAVRTAVASLTNLCSHVEAGLATARRAGEAARSVAGLRADSDPGEALRTAADRLAVLDVRVAEATAQVPVAAELDGGLAELDVELAVLRELRSLLGAGKFLHYVVEARQRALLRVGSALLGRLTRGAYGFHDDFQVVDRRTGQARSVRTLSGGETFLASMSLALALVEIAGRSGGPLDALFLDEGFGSLDATSLGDVLDVLRERASGGRLVALVSHLHAVAADIDTVLLVSRGPDGSNARLLDGDDRDRLLVEDLGASLLS